MSDQFVVTWYSTGERHPWRLVIEDNDGHRFDETHCDSFAELMLYLGDAWARIMPAPLDLAT